jgi:uncharacterized protein (DUF427 family)
MTVDGRPSTVEAQSSGHTSVGRHWSLVKGEIMKATWNNAILAESNDTVVVEGNHYFPPESVNREYFQESNSHTTCPWKGEASYYDVVVNGETNKDAAWYYPQPKEAAAEIKDRVAFWRGVKVEA